MINQGIIFFNGMLLTVSILKKCVSLPTVTNFSVQCMFLLVNRNVHVSSQCITNTNFNIKNVLVHAEINIS